MTEEIRGTFTVLPATSAEVAQSKETAEKVLDILKDWTLVTPEDEAKAAGLLASSHKRWKALDALRKSVAQPAYQAQRTINAHFKPALDAWQKAKAETQRAMQQAVTVRNAANQARIESAATGNASALAQMEDVAPPPGVSYREETHIEIVDFDKIPRDYLAVDWSKLKIMVKNGEAAPPGVSFTRKPKVVPTGR